MDIAKLRELPYWNLLANSFVTVLFLVLGIWASAGIPEADYTQNYVAARAWMRGLDPNGQLNELLLICCPDQDMPKSELYQTAHPPLTTLFVLPWTILPWRLSLWAWRIFCVGLILWGWRYAKIPTILRLLTISFSAIGLSLGTWEPLLFFCIILAIMHLDKHPIGAGVLFGFAIALKIYPVVFLLGLVITKRWHAAISTVITAGLLTILAELILGFGVTQDWLAYLPLNTAMHVARGGNVSVVRAVKNIFPDASAILVFIILLILFVAPLLPSLWRTRDLRMLIPVMLLTSPLVWSHYFIFLAFVKDVPRIVMILMGVSAIIVYGVWVTIIPGDNMAVLGYSPLLIANLILWYRDARIGLVKNTAPVQAQG